MATSQGKVTKIYDLRTLGFDQIHKELNQISKDFDAIKKAKQELVKQSSKIEDPAELAEINNQIKEATRRERELTLQLKEKVIARKEEILAQQKATTSQNNEVGQYVKLSQAYQDAKKNAEEMAATYGVESEQAIAAAQAAGKLKQELIDIHNFVKSGGAVAAQPIIVPTVIEQQNEILNQTGTVVSDLERKEADLANAATAMGQAQLEAGQKLLGEAEAVEQIKLTYDKYTGSLADNIRIQLENSQSLTANRAQQKELETAIKQAGTASDTQLQKLAALQQEENILNETNKQLSITIRNQTKEYISAQGSIDEMQAKVNLLQQTYEQLTEAERAQPFGKELKAELDVLEPQLKSFEASIGKFGRNVGNYPTQFTGALKILGQEIDVVQGKLVKGNFSEAERNKLIAQSEALQKANALVNQEFKTGAAAGKAFAQAATEIGLAYGKDSQVFKEFSKEVGAANAKIKETSVAVTASATAGSKATGVFKSIWSSIRNIANILPGVGLSSLVLLLITPFEALASSVGKAVRNLGGAKNSLDDLKKKAEETRLVFSESSNAFVQASVDVDRLRNEVRLAKDGFLDKNKVVKEFNETIGKTIGAEQNLQGVEQSLIDNGEAYIQMMLLKAAAQLSLEKAAQSAFDAEQKRQQKALEFLKTGDKIVSFGAGNVSAPGFVPGLQQQATRTQADYEKKVGEDRKKAAIKEDEDTRKRFQDIAKKLFDDAAQIAKQYGLDFTGNGPAKTRASRLSVEQQNTLQLIDAIRDRLLAEEMKQYEDLRKNNKLTEDEEIRHQNEILRINQEAIDKKLKVVGNSTPNEKKVYAELQLARVKAENDTNDAIKQIQDRFFKNELERLKIGLDNEKNAIQQRLKVITDDPTISQTAKLQAKLDADNAILNLQKQFSVALNSLEKQQQQTSLKNAKDAADAIRQTTQQILDDEKGFTLAQIQDAKAAGEKSVAEFKALIAQQRLAIANSSASGSKKEKGLAALDRQEYIGILAREVASMQIQLPLYKKRLEEKEITDTEYLKFIEELNKKLQLQLDGFFAPDDKSKKKWTDLKSFLQSQISDLFNFDSGTKEEQLFKEGLLGQAISESYAFAQDAMSSYFDAEEQRIRDNLDLQNQRLDMEKEQVLARAQSQAEIDSIEKQYAAKKKVEEAKAGEELKKVKRSEAKIALATELANIAVAAAANPANGATFGASGAIMYSILSGLAFARYALRVNEISREKFEFGGQPGMPSRGGFIKGRPHSQGGVPFFYNYEAEDKEINIVRTKNAPRNQVFSITGNHTQIASALNRLGGGVNFAAGASIKKFSYGGHIGESLKAPVFVPSASNVGPTTIQYYSDSKLDGFIEEFRNLAIEQSKRIDRMEVVQVTSSVTAAQRKQVKQSSIGTI